MSSLYPMLRAGGLCSPARRSAYSPGRSVSATAQRVAGTTSSAAPAAHADRGERLGHAVSGSAFGADRFPSVPRREPVRGRVLGLLRALLADPSEPDPSGGGRARFDRGIFRVQVEQSDLVALCGQLERTLKATAFALDAGLIGGGNVTRLDRMIRACHPRLSHQEALAMLSRRGFALRPGDRLTGAAEACLTYQYGNLPVQITGGAGDSVAYLLPHVGKALGAGGEAAELRIDLEKLVDYFLGSARRLAAQSS